MSTNLDTVPLFSALPQQELDALASRAARSFPKNAVVVNEGDETDSLYVILSGRVKFFVSEGEGKDFVLGTAGPGEYFGEIALAGGPRSASVITLETCRFVIIPKSEMKSFLATYPEVALHLIGNLSRRVRTLTENAKSLALLDVYGRVTKALLELAVQQDDKLMIPGKLTHQELANRVGASREMISRILKDLSSGDYIEQTPKGIVVHRKPPSHW
jgi:CRP/FNR family transcriptional regulator, cyclic AMP receptor protein